MTLIVAHVSATGAVMASDGLAVEADSTLGTEKKIWTSGGLLFGYAGQLSVRDELRKAIDGGLAQSPLPHLADIDAAKSQLTALIAPALRMAYENYCGSEPPEQALAGSFLIIGKDTNGYWILEIDPVNTPSNYTAGGFHTIGSVSVAGHVARYMLQHHVVPGREGRHLKLVAYRTVNSCVEVLGSGFGIGPPIQVWENTDDGFAELNDDDLASVKEDVRGWTLIERESLDQYLEAKADGADKEPLPEDLGGSGA